MASLFRAAAKHPYAPAAAPLPGYVPPTLPFTTVLAGFFGATALLCVGTWRYATSRGLAAREAAIVTWLAATAAIHIVVEGYVVTTPDYYTDTSGNFLAEIWKEYAKADSRYATRDAFTICMEAVTAFAVGPLCALAAGAFLVRRPWRHPASLIAAVCQLYGDALYFATCAYDGFAHARAEPLYRWFYFWGINGVWVVVPAALAAHNLAEIYRGCVLADGKAGALARRGSSRK